MSNRTKKTTEDSSGHGVPVWMLTYADTVTLLMCFFVMLMSFSTLDEEDLEKIRGSLIGHFGIASEDRLSRDSLLTRRVLSSSQIHVDGYENPPEHDPIGYEAQKFEIRVRSTSFANLLNYNLTKEGFEIHVLAGALFEEASAELKPSATPILDVVGSACRHLPHGIRVQAYPDPFFRATRRIASHEELALERAAAVCNYLQVHGNVAAERLSAATHVETPETVFDSGRQRQVTIAVLRAPDRQRRRQHGKLSTQERAPGGTMRARLQAVGPHDRKYKL